MKIALLPLFLLYFSISTNGTSIIDLAMIKSTIAQATSNIRVPAEWEPQEAIWLQWPGQYEKVYETNFAKMVDVISRYQKLHILYNNDRIRDQAHQAIEAVGANSQHKNLIWHHIENDNAWMRDNGPVYVVKEGEMRIQNWQFDAWGGAFGADIPFAKDNNVPNRVAELLDLPVDNINIVHERGNLEFNGKDTVILNWSTLGDPDRNPGYTKEQAEADLKRLFGVTKVVFVEGIPDGDLTRGHIDGIARFINSNTVVIPQCTENSLCKPVDNGNHRIYEQAASTIAAAGFNIIRDPIEGYVEYQDNQFDTDYMNWIVGNGFVIAVGFGNKQTDEAAKKRIQSYYPNRDIYIIEMLSSWHAGGGAHCHTNDQPAISTIHYE